MSVFKIDKLPYLLTILFVLVGWGLKHSVDRLLKSPIIEYKMEKSGLKKGQLIVYEITNISRDTVFRNLQFEFLVDTEKSKFMQDKCKLTIHPPLNIQKRADKGDGHFKFSLEEFHPSCKVGVDLELSGDVSPTLHFSTISDSGSPTSQPVMLLSSSFDTLLVKHELGIIKVLVLVWVALILVFLFAIKRSNALNPNLIEFEGRVTYELEKTGRKKEGS